MKKIIMALCAATLMTFSSCLEDAGHHEVGVYGVVNPSANAITGYIHFLSYDNWIIKSITNDSEWCKPDKENGVGGQWIMTFNLEPNTTGKSRSASFKLQDASKSDIYSPFDMVQFATRGDGSDGASPLVKAIHGDDGTEISFSYTAALGKTTTQVLSTESLPSTILIKKNGEVMTDLALSWRDTLLTVDASGSDGSLIGSYNVCHYHPTLLASKTDTVKYEYLETIGGPNSTRPFNIVYTHGGKRTVQTLRYLKANNANNYYSLGDNEFAADSLTLRVSGNGSDTYLRKYGMDYKVTLNGQETKLSNRRQNVDVNQLLFGIERCNPYQLLGTYRFGRSAFVASKATAKEGAISTNVVCNNDGSVHTLAVTNEEGKTVTYTFEY